MSVAVRVIPCLDVDDGRVVKGVNFENLRDAGDPVALARRYGEQGADELTFLDVTASSGDRATMFDVVARTAEEVFIPLTVGGGVRTVDDVDRLLRAGADKVGVNTAAIARPALIAETADRFGAQVLVLSADVRRRRDDAGRRHRRVRGDHPRRAHPHRHRRRASGACAPQELGAGEILLNSMDADGTKDGFDLELIRLVRAEVTVPVIASGWGRGGGRLRARRAGRGGCRARRQRLPLRRADHRRRSRTPCATTACPSASRAAGGRPARCRRPARTPGGGRRGRPGWWRR